MKKQPKSDIMAAVHETAAGLHAPGALLVPQELENDTHE